MGKKRRHSALITFSLLLCHSLCAQQNSDSSGISFNRIFGESKLHKYNADTLIASGDRKIIYSGRQCSITCFNRKGRKLWIKELPQDQCPLEAMLFAHPLKRGSRSRKGCELLVQAHDKSTYGVNVKTGKFYLLKDPSSPK